MAMLRLNPIQKAFLMLENRRECRRMSIPWASCLYYAPDGRLEYAMIKLDIDPTTDGMTYAEGRGRYNLLTDKIIDVCGAVSRTRGDMQTIWARHLSALLEKRDHYKAYAYKGGA